MFKNQTFFGSNPESESGIESQIRRIESQIPVYSYKTIIRSTVILTIG